MLVAIKYASKSGNFVKEYKILKQWLKYFVKK